MVCSFTGHRQIPPEHRAKLTQLIARAVAYAYGEGCRVFITGGAVGFDTLAAREVIRFRMEHSDARLILALPCIEQDAKWSDAQKNSYAFILEAADEVLYLADSYTSGCMAERNRYLAERADILIAYSGRTNSGAAQTVRMAEKLNKRVYNLYPTLMRGE
ncbi:MAG: DUF1273 family protein [Clostridia bacterium]|nr:DUF1273 family protein [Clostridia bacterium]